MYYQVLLDYGPRSNAQLLNTHGFALPTTAQEPPAPSSELGERLDSPRVAG